MCVRGLSVATMPSCFAQLLASGLEEEIDKKSTFFAPPVVMIWRGISVANGLALVGAASCIISLRCGVIRSRSLANAPLNRYMHQSVR